MNAPETTVVTIRNTADIDELIERLPSLSHSRVVVTLPEDSSLMVTAADLSRPLVEAQSANVTLVLRTNDPLRREVARMVGWSVVEEDQSPDNDEHVGAESHDQYATTADLATYVPSSPLRVRLGSLAVAGAANETAVLDVEQLDEAAEDDASEPRRNQRQGRQPSGGRSGTAKRVARGSIPGSRSRLTIVGAIAAPLLVLGVVAALLVYILPTSTITIVPQTRTISADLTYGLAAPGATYDIIIEPTPISHTTVFDKTIPATGERFEPDAAASGTIHFVNPKVDPVTIPTGTEFDGGNGMIYVTQNDVTVPGADPFISMALGSASGAVVAKQPGPDGNADAGALTGQLSNGVFYTNRDAITGGTMKRIPVVTQADIDALKAAAEEDMSARAEQEFHNSVDPALQIVDGSLTIGEPQIQIDHAAGEDAAEVSVHGTMEVRGQAYNPAELHAQAQNEAGRRLAGQAGPEVILLADSVEIGDPAPMNDQQTSFTIHAEAMVRSLITDEEREQLTGDLVGKSLDEAEQILQSMDDVARYHINVQPSWLPDRMPELASRITVKVASEDKINAGP